MLIVEHDPILRRQSARIGDGTRRTRPRHLLAPDEPRAGRAMRGHDASAPPAMHVPPVLLIVDDDALMTNLLPRKLQSAFTTPLRIVTATTPEEAAQVLRDERPDIVLSDYNLRAARTGLDVLADAAEVIPHGVRILFSGHTQREIGAAIAHAPIHGFIEKPLRLDDLLPPFARLVQDASGLELGLPPRGD
jgi:response regulator RpfG family c-di-GMP phosphodiesterase